MTRPEIIDINEASAPDRLAVAIRDAARRSPEETAIVASAGSSDRRSIDYAALAAMVDRFEAARLAYSLVPNWWSPSSANCTRGC